MIMIDYTAIIVAVIVAVPPTMMAFLAWRAGKRNDAAITEVHLSLNSRLSQLLKASTGEAEARGLAAGREESRAGRKIP